MKKQEEIFLALKRNDFETIETCLKSTLFSKKADINCKNEHGKTLIISAVELNDFNMSKFLIDKGADLNLIDNNGKSPLWYAVENKNYEIVNFLIDKGAKIEMPNENDKTLFNLAIKKEALEIAILLIEKNSNDSEILLKSNTLIETAISCKNSNKYFDIINNAISMQKNYLSQSMLDNYLWLSVKNWEIDLIKLFLTNGADINATVAGNISILQSYDFFCIINFNLKNDELEEFLSNFKIDINKVVSDNGMTPLLHAVSNGDKRRVEILLKFGAILNIKNGDGNTELHFLSEQTFLESHKSLLEKEYYIENYEYLKGDSFYAKKLDDFDEKYKGVDISASKTKIEIAELLINHGADINIKNNDNLNPILYSFAKHRRYLQPYFISKYGNSSVVDFIVNKFYIKYDFILGNIYDNSLFNLKYFMDLKFVEIVLISALHDKNPILKIKNWENEEFGEKINFYFQLFNKCLGHKKEELY